MIKRKIALEYMKIAGYHNDTAAFTRLYCESRINPAICREQFRIGYNAKINGIKCNCSECKMEGESI